MSLRDYAKRTTIERWRGHGLKVDDDTCKQVLYILCVEMPSSVLHQLRIRLSLLAILYSSAEVSVNSLHVVLRVTSISGVIKAAVHFTPSCLNRRRHCAYECSAEVFKRAHLVR